MATVNDGRATTPARDVVADTIHTKADIKGGIQAAQIVSNDVMVALRKAGYTVVPTWKLDHIHKAAADLKNGAL